MWAGTRHSPRIERSDFAENGSTILVIWGVDSDPSRCYTMSMSTQQLYDAFVVEAFTQYRIPNTITMKAKDWVCAEARLETKHRLNDLGYAELRDIKDYDAEMKEFSFVHSLDNWEQCEESMSQEHRIGKGAYRLLLKLFYLYATR